MTTYSELLQIRLSPLSMEVLRQIAELEQRNMSDVVRDLIRERAKELHLWPGYERTQEEPTRRIVVDAGDGRYREVDGEVE